MSTDDWEAVELLAEPTRRRVYAAVHRASTAMTRGEVAADVGIDRRLAAFHLDRLAAAGLLESDFARPPGRSGPGAGRPAKRYRATRTEVSVDVPPRRYELVASLLARGLSAGSLDAARTAATATGRRIGDQHRLRRATGSASTLRRAAETLAALGFEPMRDGRVLRMRNCPFQAVATESPEVVCALNESLVGGVLEGLGGDPGVTAALDGCPGDCCVTVAAR